MTVRPKLQIQQHIIVNICFHLKRNENEGKGKSSVQKFDCNYQMPGGKGVEIQLRYLKIHKRKSSGGFSDLKYQPTMGGGWRLRVDQGFPKGCKPYMHIYLI